MVDPSQAERLRQIADEIRQLSGVRNLSPAEFARTADDLVVEAIELGAFADTTHARFRALVRTQQVLFPNDAMGVFVEAMECLLGVGCGSDWKLSGGPVADMIDAEAVKARPAEDQDDGKDDGSLLDQLADILTNQGHQIVKFLWNHKHSTTYDTLKDIPNWP